MRQKFPIILALILATVLRLMILGQNPPGLYWDEVSLGYNAYSILKTGRDEHGEFLPYSRFKAFGDYKPPGYVYASVPSIGFFGLNNFAVRFPSALAGIFTVFLAYLIAKELFPERKLRFKSVELGVGELTAFLLAISPWHVQLSRVGFESVLATMFNSLGVFLFLRSRKKPALLILSAISFVATVYTFNANRLLSILLVVLLSVVFFKHLLKNIKTSIFAGVIGLLLILPLVPHLRSTEGKLRWHEVNIFSNLDVIKDSNSQIAADGGSRLGKLIHHRYLGHAQNFLRHYFDHFNGRYLFLKGDINPRFSLQDIGELYLIELPFILFGIYFLLVEQKNKKLSALVIGWLLLAPIPAATARETPHALRTLSMLPVPQIIVALGLIYSFKLIKIPKKLLFIVYFVLFTLSLAHFQFIYYRYYPNEYAGEWLTSYPRMIDYLNQSSEAQAASKITIVPDLGRPYIYFLFYNKYSPHAYFDQAIRTGDAFGFFTVHGFDKYQFKNENPNNISSGDIYVVRASTEIEGFEKLSTISDVNGFEQFAVLKKL